MEEELSSHLTYMISEKQNKLLKYVSSWGNPFLMVIFQLFVITMYRRFVQHSFRYMHLLRNGIGNIKNLLFNKNNVIKLKAKEIKYSHNNRSNWELTDLTKAIFWYLNKNIKSFDNIRNLVEITSRSYNIYDDEIESVNKKTFKEASYRIDQHDQIYIGNDIYVKFLYSHEEDDRITDGKSSKFLHEVCEIEVSSRKKSIWELKEFCKKIHKEYIDFINENSLTEQHIFVYLGKDKNGRKLWRKLLFTTNKSRESLFIDNREEILNVVQQMINSKEYYRKIGKPYQISLMLDGPPGCGKNSLFKVIMKEMFSGDNLRHLIIIPPDSIGEFTDFEDILYDSWIDGYFIPTNKRVYQIDEIEKAFPVLLDSQDIISETDAKRNYLKKKKIKVRNIDETFDGTKDSTSSSDDEDDQITESKEFKAFFENMKKEEYKKQQKELSKWLNCFDGAIEQDGRTFFMSSNAIKKLNKTFMRPGRIDKLITLDYASNDVACKLIKYVSEL